MLRRNLLFSLSTLVFFNSFLFALASAPTFAQSAEAARERRVVAIPPNKTVPPMPVLPAPPRSAFDSDKGIPPLKTIPLRQIKSASQQGFQHRLLSAINLRLGLPYRFGSTGPDSFDCSGFVWSVFQEAGINLERMSAFDLWQMSVPAREDEKWEFGTLVFFNNLHHVGIVADQEGFYHASTTQGVVYSRFEGYWERRIVGYRRLPVALVNE